MMIEVVLTPFEGTSQGLVETPIIHTGVKGHQQVILLVARGAVPKHLKIDRLGTNQAFLSCLSLAGREMELQVGPNACDTGS
jgi:hypothetical protein